MSRKQPIRVAEEYLRRELSTGPKSSQTLIENAPSGVELRTLQRARVSIGAKSTRAGFGPGGEWTWSLPLPCVVDLAIQPPEASAPDPRAEDCWHYLNSSVGRRICDGYDLINQE